jgi:hypothetical protein
MRASAVIFSCVPAERFHVADAEPTRENAETESGAFPRGPLPRTAFRSFLATASDLPPTPPQPRGGVVLTGIPVRRKGMSRRDAV